MRWLVLLFVAGCTVQQDLGPAITCSNVSLSTSPGGCDLVANSACSDSNLYEVDCQDDGTCTCAENGSVLTSIIASNQASGYCGTLATSQLHDLAALCGWNINP